jgi:signal transduction histidine kinase
MRTPLNIMNLSLGFVESEGVNLKKLVESKHLAPMMDAIGDIKESCQTATSILDDFLTLDKMQGGKMTVELVDVKPLKFAMETYRLFTLVAQQKEVEFLFVCDEQDRAWVRQVCLHLDTMKFAQVSDLLLMYNIYVAHIFPF